MWGGKQNKWVSTHKKHKCKDGKIRMVYSNGNHAYATKHKIIKNGKISFMFKIGKIIKS